MATNNNTTYIRCSLCKKLTSTDDIKNLEAGNYYTIGRICPNCTDKLIDLCKTKGVDLDEDVGYTPATLTF